MEGTSTEEDLLKREIEDISVVNNVKYHSVVSNVKYHPVTGKNKANYHDNLMCYVVSSHDSLYD